MDSEEGNEWQKTAPDRGQRRGGLRANEQSVRTPDRRPAGKKRTLVLIDQKTDQASVKQERPKYAKKTPIQCASNFVVVAHPSFTPTAGFVAKHPPPRFAPPDGKKR